MRALFFGDSITSAENNNYNSFVKKLKLKKYRNYGVSGTTIGNYSLYPVGETDLLHLTFKYKSRIRKTDYIFIEYGINDIASVVVGYTTLLNVKFDLNKCIDNIMQINPKAKIVYLVPSDLKSIALRQYKYLRDYLRIKEEKTIFINRYITGFIELIKYVNTLSIDVINLIKIEDRYIDSDNLHPNDEGYQIIANQLKEDLIKYDKGFNKWFK